MRKIQSLRSSTYTLIFLSNTLRLKDLYIQIRSCGPSLPISLSVSLTGSAEIPGTRCQPPHCFHLHSPNQHLSLSLSLFHALRSGLCPAAHCSRVGLDRFLELLYEKSSLSSAPVYSAFAASLPTLSNIRQIVCCEHTHMLACLLLL